MLTVDIGVAFIGGTPFSVLHVVGARGFGEMCDLIAAFFDWLGDKRFSYWDWVRDRRARRASHKELKKK